MVRAQSCFRAVPLTAQVTPRPHLQNTIVVAGKGIHPVVSASSVVESAVGVALAMHVTSTVAAPALPRSRTPTTVTTAKAGVTVPFSSRVKCTVTSLATLPSLWTYCTRAVLLTLQVMSMASTDSDGSVPLA